jgi:alpha-L-fucosidase
MHITRRQFVGAAALAVGTSGPRTLGPLDPWTLGPFAQSVRPRPTPSQLRWQRDELALFIHFGVNTFTDREWGDGKESPSIFAPAALDCAQWARTAKAAGARALILTAKHHDGFCLWPTRTTTHSVAASPWRSGGGDLVREFVTACREHELGAGLYLSPWDRNHPTYGDSDRYNDVYITQLTELLTNYGPLVEVWFDGANGEGPNGKRQVYDWPRVWSTVRRLQPDAVMFSDAGPDVRWSGNEAGTAGEPNWSPVDPTRVAAPGVSGPGVIDALQHGDRHGSIWRPAECDTSIRPGWFYHPAEDTRVKSADRLTQIYQQSVGRNSKLLLNVPPTPAGLLHDADVKALSQMRGLIRSRFGDDVGSGTASAPSTAAQIPARYEVTLKRPATLGFLRFEEDITRGQAIAQYVVEGFDGREWLPLSSGSTIGFAKIDTVIEPASVQRLRVTVTNAVEAPGPLNIRAFPQVRP